MSGIIWVCPQSSLPAIDVVQNVYHDLGLSQAVARDGSEWTRSVVNSDIVEQSFSEFYGETVTSTLALSSLVASDTLLTVAVSSAIVFSQANTVAGGRVDSGGGGGGDTISTFSITYHTGGPSAVKGQVVYIDGADSEAKLAAYNGVAEAAGFLTESATSGASVTIQTEGEIELSDWTAIIGTTNLTPGATYYLSTGGLMTATPPAGTIVVLGRAMTPTRFDIEINLPWE